jgi:beta-glucosidase-like glycosyl hydrolase/CubicO group peptidase (beta-lactamase class C family)
MKLVRGLFVCAIAVLFIGADVQRTPKVANTQPSAIWQGDSAWALDVLSKMSLDEKVGQLFMVAAYSNKGEQHKSEIDKLVKDEHIGGLIFFQGNPATQARLTNLYQMHAKVPLMIAMDAEWGLAMRLDSTFKFPWPLTMGAMRDTVLAYKMGVEVAKHCKRLGVHINFAPVVDVNTNPNNPIINARSFGENPQRVARMSAAYMKGMQSQGVMANAKHFPGHGDTDSDSHKTLPTVSQKFERLNAVELYPYKVLFKQGLASVMAAHLNVPALDPSGMPTSLSRKVVTGFLKDSLGFDGLVFTDALNMKGVSARYKPGEVDLKAFEAGNDVLLFAEDVKLAKEKIIQAIKDSSVSMQQLNRSVLKILMAKSWMGLKQKTAVSPKKLTAELNPVSSELINKRIFQSAATLLLNKNSVLPVRELANKKIAVVLAGTEIGGAFAKTAARYTQVETFTYSEKDENQLLNQLNGYDLVITGLYTSNQNPWKSYKLDGSVKRFVKRLTLQNNTIISLFANPYSLNSFPEATDANALLVAYQNHPDAEEAAAQIIFGALGASGVLPVTASDVFVQGFGLQTQPINRLGYSIPEEVGLNSNELMKIDLIAEEAIRQHATPGCQILVARYGKVVYNKTFGYHTYSKKEPVREDDLYDIASITKIAASVPLLMKLVDEGKIDLNKTLGDYLPELKGSNKEKLVIREVLAHQGRLKPWIPFYLETLEKGKRSTTYYSSIRDFDFSNVVAHDLYSNRYSKDTIFKRIVDSDLLPTKEYKYSDLGYYLFMRIIERIEGKPLEVLAQEHFYGPLGASNMMYNPLLSVSPEHIVPTENDRAYRGQELRGYVHDQGAALMGGVAGHAGLFTNANDLAKLMQMYLQRGSYGGVQYFDSVTVSEFTRCQYCETDNRRGVGFDKPQLSGPGPTCGCVSPLSFGHSGFTGTLAWADPKEEIVYIFLSNRVHPDAENKKLLTMSTRTKIQEVIYNALIHENETTGQQLIGVVESIADSTN